MTKLPITEVTLFETSDAFRTNPDILLPTIRQFKAKGGLDVPIYYGIEANERSNTGFVFVNWDSHEQHRAIMETSSYSEFAEKFRPALAGPPTVYHVQFSGPTVALDHPVTEVVPLTLKNTEDERALVEHLSFISERGPKTFVFEKTQEDANKYIILAGWSSIEEHQEAISRPKAVEALQKLSTLADRDCLYYTNLKRA